MRCICIAAELKNDRELPFEGFEKVREADQGWAWSEVSLVYKYQRRNAFRAFLLIRRVVWVYLAGLVRSNVPALSVLRFDKVCKQADKCRGQNIGFRWAGG